MKYVVVFFILFTTLFAQKLVNPTHVYKLANGLATDIVIDKDKLYVSTDTGFIDIFDTKKKKVIEKISLDKITDFMGDTIESKIFSIDLMDGELLVLSQDSGGYSRLHILKNKKLNAVLTKENKLNIIKAKFIDKETILLALISNDIISYNIKTKKRKWTTQASMSKFSNFALNNNRSKVAIADESGNVHIFATKDGKLLQTLSGENVDNIFSIDFKGDTVLTGGQDRRAAVYNIKNKNAYYIKSSFFIYGVGLSPSGKIGAYSSDINNNVTLFNTTTREPFATYKATKMVVNSIYFINEKAFYIISNSPEIDYYKTK
jgi:hypothetical protein